LSLADRFHFDSLVNEAERLVVEEIGRQLPAHGDLCTCDECLMDIAAHALNKVRPRYRVSLLDRVLGNRSDANAYSREVRRAVTEAILKIKANPSHD
jgi:competence protein ComFB